MGQIKFSAFHCRVNDVSNAVLIQRDLKKDDFPISPTLSWTYQPEDYTSHVTYKIVRQPSDTGIFFSAEFGAPLPRREKIFNTEDHTERDNTRTENEAELREQFFVYFDLTSHIMYISNSQKKKIVKEFIKHIFNIEIELSFISRDIDEFISLLSECREISFTGIENLYTTDNDLRSSVINLAGLDAPDQFTIIAKYSGKQISPWIRKLHTFFTGQAITKLVVKGRDSEGFEAIFNSDHFQQKIAVHCAKNTESMYEYNQVYDKLMEKLYKNE